MSSVNKVILVGNVGQPPVVKEVNGQKVANFSLACSEKYKNKAGEVVESTEWVSVSAWGKVCDVIEKYVLKGSNIYVEGKLKTRSYDKDGQKHYATDVILSELVLLGSKQSQSSAAPVSEEAAGDDLPF